MINVSLCRREGLSDWNGVAEALAWMVHEGPQRDRGAYSLQYVEGPKAKGGMPIHGKHARVVHTLDELDELSGPWTRLAAQADSPMQDHGWIRACALSFAGGSQLHFVLAGTPPDICAIAPLVRRQGALDRLELLGVDVLQEPLDFLSADSAALAQVANGLARSGLPLFLNRLPADSPVVGALRRAYRGRGVVICSPGVGTPWIPLDRGELDPERRQSASQRSALRRARRIAERAGPVTHEVLSPTPTELGPLLDEAFRVEAAGWKGRAGTALASDPSRADFFRRYATTACLKGVLRLCFLRIGGRAAATQLAVEWAKRFWLLKIGYDERFARCSPGTLLMLETLRYAAARRLVSYELLGGVEPWTQVWTRRVRPCVVLRAYPASSKGMAALVADAAKFTWRRARRITEDDHGTRERKHGPSMVACAR